MGVVKVDSGIASAASGTPADTISAGAVSDVRSQCGPLVSGVDGLVSDLTGFSPLQEWVIKPLAGDWSALGRAASAWDAGGTVAQGLSHALQSLPGQVGTDWQGSAQSAWKDANSKLEGAVDPLVAECQGMSQLCVAIVNAGDAIVGLVVAIIEQLVSTVVQMLSETAIPVVGEIADGADIAWLALQIAQWTQQIQQAVQQFIALLAALHNVVSEFSANREYSAKIADALNKQISDALNTAGSVIGDVGNIVSGVANVASTVQQIKGGRGGTKGTHSGGEHGEGGAAASHAEPGHEATEPHIGAGEVGGAEKGVEGAAKGVEGFVSDISKF